MGKGRKKKATIDYDELFRSEPKKSEDDWFCGFSALMLDDDPSAPAKMLPTLAGAAAADGMDTTDIAVGGRKKRKQKQQGLKLQSASLKTVRGRHTTVQKKRRAGKLEKAVARADKASVKVSRKLSKKQQLAALKALY